MLNLVQVILFLERETGRKYHYSTVQQWVKRGQIPAIREGGRWFTNEAGVRAALEQRSIPGQSIQFDWDCFEREEIG